MVVLDTLNGVLIPKSTAAHSISVGISWWEGRNGSHNLLAAVIQTDTNETIAIRMPAAESGERTLKNVGNFDTSWPCLRKHDTLDAKKIGRSALIKGHLIAALQLGPVMSTQVQDLEVIFFLVQTFIPQSLAFSDQTLIALGKFHGFLSKVGLASAEPAQQFVPLTG